MSEKINLSLDEIIAKEGITAERKPNLTKRVVKSDTNGLQNVIFEVNNDSSVRSTKRKAIPDEESCLTSVCASTTAAVKGSHFPPTFGQIFVDNLKYQVNDEDITQLFGAFGTLKRCAINYQCDGRSAGTAFIVFENRSHAEEAVKSLNNITLDGRPLQLTLIDSKNSSFNRNSNNLDSRVKHMAKDTSGGGKGQIWSEMSRNWDSMPTEQRTAFRRFNKTKENESKEKPSAEDLDADLESYLAQRTK